MKREFGDCSSIVIAACIEVHRELGPGLLEAIYEECLCDELTRRGLGFERQKAFSVSYKGRILDHGYRTDLVVERSLLVEVKAVEALLPVHAAQVVTYLRVCGLEAGLLVNFNALTIRSGLRRVSRHPQTFRSSDLPVKKSGSV
jgi:GxxExxY protein